MEQHETRDLLHKILLATFMRFALASEIARMEDKNSEQQNE
jgi:hypothetical protein